MTSKLLSETITKSYIHEDGFYYNTMDSNQNGVHIFNFYPTGIGEKISKTELCVCGRIYELDAGGELHFSRVEKSDVDAKNACQKIINLMYRKNCRIITRTSDDSDSHYFIVAENGDHPCFSLYFCQLEELEKVFTIEPSGQFSSKRDVNLVEFYFHNKDLLEGIEQWLMQD